MKWQIPILVIAMGVIPFNGVSSHPDRPAKDRLIASAVKTAKLDKSRCTYNGIPLKGKVKVVTSFADIKVKVVESFPDIKVKTVTSFPDDCGEWQFVESFPDFTIQYVESFPDVQVKFVTSFPGMD